MARKPKTKLTNDERLYATIQLAMRATSSEIVDAMDREFAIDAPAELIKQWIEECDPETPNENLVDPELEPIFRAVRRSFDALIAKSPSHHRAYRIQRLDRMARIAEHSGDYELSARLLEQAARETTGGFSVWVSDA